MVNNLILVTGVIVTYGDRFHLLKRVIKSSFLEGVDKIIVIDNNSEENSKKQLKEYEEQENRLSIIYLNENTGSAGGYKRGLEEAYNDGSCEFIWLLDDDNEPQKDSLKVLKEFWKNLEDKTKKEKISLLSYRKDRVAYKESIMTENPDLVLGRKNSFLGFHILDLFNKIIKVFKRKIGIETYKENENVRSGKVSVAPYGGMFFRSKIIKENIYPNNILSGDKALYILISLSGTIKYSSKIMGIYRKHEGGISSWVTYDLMKQDLNMIPWICNLDHNFPKYKLLSIIHKTIILHSNEITLKNLIYHSINFILYSFSYFPKNIKTVGAFLFKTFPKLIMKY